MAYGLIYTVTFKNRIQNDIYRSEIWQKDYAGDVTELNGSETPFVATYQDAEILTPIKSVEFTLSFFNNATISIKDFYSDDDEEFRIDHYFQSLADGTGTEKFLYSGYLVQDGATGPVTDRNHILTLKATDNLALLKNVKWSEAIAQPFGQYPLSLYFRQCLEQTGLYSAGSTIDKSLPLRIYGNIFENTTDDKSDDDQADTFKQTILHSGIFQNTDNTWSDCYEVLTKILTGMNACLAQADGCWNIWRPAEYRLFTDGAIPGVEFAYNGIGTDVDAITLAPVVNIARTGGDCYPIEENQTEAIQRPIKSVLNTFQYNQPGSFIIQNDLQLPEGATPYDTNTTGDLRFDDYDLATYFPDWVQRDGDTSYLEVVTDTSLDPEQESDRYIVTPSPDDNARGVQFNPIPVTKGDVINFRCQYKMFGDTDNAFLFGVRFIIISNDGNAYQLLNSPDPISSSNPGLIWTLQALDDWDSLDAAFRIIKDSEANDIDTTQYIDYSLSGIISGTMRLPIVPAEGMMLVQVCGTNFYGGSANHTIAWKDMELTIENFINESTQITGQTHLDTGISTIKATEENDLDIDDSPRNSIAGTLFTDAITSFDHTDVTTLEETNIGNVYFTKTNLWHRGPITENLRLGNIITQERLLFKLTSRLIIEGTFRNLRYDTDKFISILSFFNVGFYAGSHFLPARLEIDFMDCSFQSKLIEIYNDTDVAAQTVFLTGAKEEQLGISSGNISYDDITYFGGADTYLTPTLTNSRFTYNGFDTTLDLSIIFQVPISGSGTATFTVLKNGGVIATQTLNAIAVFGVIDFHITSEAVTDGDYFEAAVDTGGADVDIQMGSINITVNGVLSIGDQYKFNYLYKTD